MSFGCVALVAVPKSRRSPSRTFVDPAQLVASPKVVGQLSLVAALRMVSAKFSPTESYTGAMYFPIFGKRKGAVIASLGWPGDPVNVSRQSASVRATAFSIACSHPALQPVTRATATPLKCQRTGAGKRASGKAPSASNGFVLQTAHTNMSTMASTPATHPLFRISFSYEVR